MVGDPQAMSHGDAHANAFRLVAQRQAPQNLLDLIDEWGNQLRIILKSESTVDALQRMKQPRV
jgi:hypothetical protein